MTLAPIVAPSINVTLGTQAEFDVNPVYHGLPFSINGTVSTEEAVGALAQEWWECAWCQRNAVIAASVALGVFAFAGLFAFGVAGLLAGPVACLLAIWLVGHWQNAPSEEFSHAISVQAALIYDGLTLERAEQCFVANLAGYSYSRPCTAENCRSHYGDARLWVNANQDLMQRFLTMKTAALKGAA